MTFDPTAQRRFSGCLADVLLSETGYVQPVGGPYRRFVGTKSYNDKLRKSGHAPMPLGRYEWIASSQHLRAPDGSLYGLPPVPDGHWYDDDPRDRGGRTAAGILQREYDPWRRARSLPTQDAWLISDGEVDTIYRTQYWDAIHGDDLPAGLDCVVMHIAVLNGVGIGIRLLQRAAGVKGDGHFGLASREALGQSDIGDLIAVLCRHWRTYLRQCKTFEDFGDAWLARVDAVERRAGAMAYRVQTAPDADSDVPVPSRKAALPTQPATVAASPDAWTATTTGAGGGGIIATEMPAAVERAAASPWGLTPTGIIYALALSPTFWCGVIAVGGAAYLWFRNRRNIILQGV